MLFLSFVLGVMVGLLSSTFLFVAATRYTVAIQRTINQTESKLKTKGAIIEQRTEEVLDWVKSLEDENV